MKIEITCKCGEVLQIFEIKPEDCIKTPNACMQIEFDAWHCCDSKVAEGIMG